MSYQSLYRRYRPRRFADIRGQEHIVTALGPTAYVVATLVAIVAPYVALALFGGIAVFFAIGSRTTDPG